MTRAVIASIALFCAALFPSAQTNETPDAGKIESVRAPAVLIRDNKVSDAKPGDVLKINDIVQTGKSGRLRIALKDGSTLSLGQGSELRVVAHDPSSQITLIEMLHGRVRAHVTSIAKAGGIFEIRTPTARVRALGTVISLATEVETQSATIGNVIDQRTVDQLPLNGRDFVSLVQLQPGAQTGTPGQPSLFDFEGVKSTGVTAEDHFASVTNFNPQIPGQTDLLPGEFTIVPRNLPPQPATPMYFNGNDYSQEFKDFRLRFNLNYSVGGFRPSDTANQTPPPARNPECGRGSVINGTYVPLRSPSHTRDLARDSPIPLRVHRHNRHLHGQRAANPFFQRFAVPVEIRCDQRRNSPPRGLHRARHSRPVARDRPAHGLSANVYAGRQSLPEAGAQLE